MKDENITSKQKEK